VHFHTTIILGRCDNPHVPVRITVEGMAYADLDRVALTRDTAGLIAGAVGTVVGVYGSGGYEVEFLDPDGRTLAVLTLDDTDIRPV
jgi:uncharacterized membrane protein